MKRLLIFLPLFIFMVACEKDANVKLPDNPPKLVVTSFISPQDALIRVNVNKSTPIFKLSPIDEDPEFSIPDVLVQLSNGEETVTLEYDEFNKVYYIGASEFPIEEGITYFLTVVAPGGYNASASCTVPLNNNTLDFTYVKKPTDMYGNIPYEITATWASSPNDAHAFRLAAESMNTIDVYGTPHDTYSTIFINDNLLPSEEANFDKTLVYYHYDHSEITEKKFYLYLLNVEENYYKYHRDVNEYQDNSPFSEPAPTYTNIEGGLGVFAAYNRTTVVKEY